MFTWVKQNWWGCAPSPQSCATTITGLKRRKWVVGHQKMFCWYHISILVHTCATLEGYRCLFFWLLGPAFIGNFLLLSVRSALRGKFYFPSSSRSRADVSRLLPECLRVSDRASRVPSLSIEPCIMILIVVVVNLTKKLIFGSTGGKLSDL